MIKTLITTGLLFFSIFLIAIGINTGNNILTVIGSFCVGSYNSIMMENNDDTRR